MVKLILFQNPFHFQTIPPKSFLISQIISKNLQVRSTQFLFRISRVFTTLELLAESKKSQPTPRLVKQAITFSNKSSETSESPLEMEDTFEQLNAIIAQLQWMKYRLEE